MNDARQPFSDMFADLLDGESPRMRRVHVILSKEAPEGRALLITDAEGRQWHWPVDTLRALADQAGRGGVILHQAGPSPERLVISDPDAAGRLRALCPNLGKRQPIRHAWRLLGWGIGAVGAVFLIIMVLVPFLANQLAALLPPDAEKALGDATLEQIATGLDRSGVNPIRSCTQEKGLAALAKMQTRLAGEMELPYPVQVHVLDHPMVNAFALPGGHVVFFRGLINEAETPEEVAAVFAHELGHVAHRDPARIALRTAGSVGVLGLLFGDFAGGTVVLFLTERLVQASYTREAEALADAFAHDILIRSRVSPAALASMFERLRARYGDAEGIVAHFANHPALIKRIEAARSAAEHAGGKSEPILDAAAWADLKGICAPPSGLSDILERFKLGADDGG